MRSAPDSRGSNGRDLRFRHGHANLGRSAFCAERPTIFDALPALGRGMIHGSWKKGWREGTLRRAAGARNRNCVAGTPLDFRILAVSAHVDQGEARSFSLLLDGHDVLIVLLADLELDVVAAAAFAG